MLTPLNAILAICLAAVSLGFYAFWIEPRRLIVTELTLPLKDLDEKIRLVMIADPQPSGPHHTAERLQRIMARAAALQGDIIVLLGDYVSIGGIKTTFTEPADTVTALGRLKAPMGVYAVLGNHDWWWGGRKMRHLLEAEGIVVLEDDARLARYGAKALWIAGLPDPVTRRYDLRA
ncbi:MAG TPA: metallophosphoesterase, partial [Kiloniellaceae bacterium]|nr:metallophosphoesterase [Kiloniellaceae bacterium]